MTPAITVCCDLVRYVRGTRYEGIASALLAMMREDETSLMLPTSPNHTLLAALGSAAEAYDLFGVDLRIKPAKHQTKVIVARQYAMYLLRQAGWSYPRIAAALGLQDHTTVMHGVRMAQKRLENAA